MKLFFFPILYRESTGYLSDESVLVRLGKDTKTVGLGDQWRFQKVKRVFPFIYEPDGESYYDFKDMYSKVK